MSRHLVVSLLMMVVVAVALSGTFSINRLAADAGVPPIAYAFWQSLGAALALLVVVRIRGERLGLTRAHLKSYLITGALALAIPTSLLTYVAPHLPAGALSLVQALSPPITYAISMAVGLDRFRILGLLGLLFGFAGVAVLVGPGLPLALPGAWEWYLLALLAPLLFASSNVTAAVLSPPAASPASMACGILLGSATALLPVLAATGESWTPFQASSAALPPILYAILIDAISLVLFIVLVRRAGPTFFSQFNYLAVLCGVGWGMMVFGEQPNGYLLLAMILMLVGVFCANYRPRAPVPAAVTPGG